MGGSRRRRWALLGRAPKMRGARVKVMKKEMDGGTKTPIGKDQLLESIL